IADMREGEGDDLAGIGRVGQDFLITGNRRVEADLADRLARRAEASPPKYRPVRQHQGRVAVGRSRPFHSRGRVAHQMTYPRGVSEAVRPLYAYRAARTAKGAPKRPKHKGGRGLRQPAPPEVTAELSEDSTA